MFKTKIEFMNQPVWFIEFDNCTEYIEKRTRADPNDGMCICAISGEKLNEKTGIYLVICNAIFFPNCCVSKSLVDKLGFEVAAQNIKDSWKAAQRFAHWFQ